MQNAKEKTRNEDKLQHGGWEVAVKYEEVTGNVAIQFRNSCYMKVMDDGKIVLGKQHGDGEGPDPKEIVMAMPGGEHKVAFKSGGMNGSFLRLDSQQMMVKKSKKVSWLEMFQLVWLDGKCAIIGPNNKFLTADNGGLIGCTGLPGVDDQIIRIRLAGEGDRQEKPTASKDTDKKPSHKKSAKPKQQNKKKKKSGGQKQ